MVIDLRSDTVTQPSAAMRKAMADAEVGDDVFREDPTVNELQHYAADMFGMEDALYCSSGTQTNQIAIAVHTRPGDEVVCASQAHIYLYEGGGIASNAGASVRLIEGDRGRITVTQVMNNINADDAHYPKTTLVCVENTMNKGGGALYDLNELEAIAALCRKHKLAFHCDGARLMNAVVADSVDPKVFGSMFDTISLCLSKGLGAPVGSLLLGSKDFIYHAHRKRKSFGGGMRQAGIIAAAGLYALKNNVGRLTIDHENARVIADLLRECEWVDSIYPVETNIVIAKLASGIHSSAAMKALEKEGIRSFTFGEDKIRMVTHLDITEKHIAAFREQIKRVTNKQIGEAAGERLAGMY
jgi:threonine aldolase